MNEEHQEGRPSPRDSGSATEPKVSVIIPCYNQAQFLGDAIYSALHQTHTRVEVIVVDDGSEDGAREVAEWDGWGGAVRYLRQENRGPSAARNTGLRASTGAFTVFLDADDRLLPGAVEAGLSGFREHPESAFVFGSHRYIDVEGEVMEVPPEVPPALGQRLAALRAEHADTYRTLLQGNYVGMHAAVIYRRACLVAAGGFDEQLRGCEDWDMYLRLAREHPAHDHGERVAEYRKHGSNVSGDPLLMLRSALAVLRAQRPRVDTDPRCQQAYEAGERLWRSYYGSKLAAEVAAGTKRKQRKRALAAAVALLRLAPEQYETHRHPRLALTTIAVCRAPGALAEQAGRRLRVLLPAPVLSWWRRVQAGPEATMEGRPAVNRVRFGDLRRVEPVSRVFGFDRGLPVDRYYIEAFLARHAGDVRGRVLEVGDDTYTRRFGGEHVTKRDVLHVVEGNPRATFVGDLSDAPGLPSDAFDCIILTQTLHLIYDVRAALATLHRILRPGGVALATFPGISHIAGDEWGATWHWGFTTHSARRLFEEAFEDVAIEAYGNVLAATAFLQGIATEELEPDELDHVDPLYQVLISARAVKVEEAP